MAKPTEAERDSKRRQNLVEFTGFNSGQQAAAQTARNTGTDIQGLTDVPLNSLSSNGFATRAGGTSNPFEALMGASVGGGGDGAGDFMQINPGANVLEAFLANPSNFSGANVLQGFTGPGGLASQLQNVALSATSPLVQSQLQTADLLGGRASQRALDSFSGSDFGLGARHSSAAIDAAIRAQQPFQQQALANIIQGQTGLAGQLLSGGMGASSQGFQTMGQLLGLFGEPIFMAGEGGGGTSVGDLLMAGLAFGFGGGGEGENPVSQLVNWVSGQRSSGDIRNMFSGGGGSGFGLTDLSSAALSNLNYRGGGF